MVTADDKITAVLRALKNLKTVTSHVKRKQEDVKFKKVLKFFVCVQCSSCGTD